MKTVLFLFLSLFLFYAAQCTIYLTVEEVEAIYKSREPYPYNGSRVTNPLLQECFYHDNVVDTYFICPFKYIIRVSNEKPNNRGTIGIFSDFTGDAFNHERIVSEYTDGAQCPGHQMSQATLTIECDSSIDSSFEIISVDSMNSCLTTIIAKSPLVCQLSPDQKRYSDMRDRLYTEAKDLLEDIHGRIENLLAEFIHYSIVY